MTATNIERRTVLTLKTLALSTMLIASAMAPALAQNDTGVTSTPPNMRGTGSELGVQPLNSLPTGAATAIRRNSPGGDIGTTRVGPAPAAPTAPVATAR